jgi:hypothetical protein
MFFTVVEKATEVRDALTDNYKLLARFAEQSGDEVAKAADMYRDTDQAAAGSADATYHQPAATRTPHYS